MLLQFVFHVNVVETADHKVQKFFLCGELIEVSLRILANSKISTKSKERKRPRWCLVIYSLILDTIRMGNVTITPGESGSCTVQCAYCKNCVGAMVHVVRAVCVHVVRAVCVFIL